MSGIADIPSASRTLFFPFSSGSLSFSVISCSECTLLLYYWLSCSFVFHFMFFIFFFLVSHRFWYSAIPNFFLFFYSHFSITFFISYFLLPESCVIFSVSFTYCWRSSSFFYYMSCSLSFPPFCVLFDFLRTPSIFTVVLLIFFSPYSLLHLLLICHTRNYLVIFTSFFSQ